MRMSIPRRLIVITAGLDLAGAFSGALSGVVAIQTGVLVVIDLRNRSSRSGITRANER
jgi:hypothetical protein